ncbi:MAG: response regulator [Clostridiales Family XIII bacterium]|nr:response regulator [Clostridiales Family XIII bacterium]
MRGIPNPENLEAYAAMMETIKKAASGICAELVAAKAGALETAALEGRYAFVQDYHVKFTKELCSIVSGINAMLAAPAALAASAPSAGPTGQPHGGPAEPPAGGTRIFGGHLPGLHKLQCIVLVDDNLADLATARSMLNTFYRLHTVSSGDKLFELLDAMQPLLPDLILLDAQMPGMDGFAVMKQIKADALYRRIPIVLLTTKNDEASEMEGLALGAVDYVYKPFSAPLLQRRIENQLLIAKQNQTLREQAEDLERCANSLHDMVVQKTGQVVGLQNAVLGTVAELIEFRDDVTGNHVVRTQRYIKLLIDRLLEEGTYLYEMEDWDPDILLPSTQLHDVGKIAISDAILNKPGKLTDEEFEIMKTHAAIGVEIIDRIAQMTEEHELLRYAKRIAGTHHEWWDGTGYPYGLVGSMIPLEGRLMAIADVYDALISTRPYKKAIPPAEAAEIIREGSGTHFDPALVRAFDAVADQFASIALETDNRLPPGRPSLQAVTSDIGRVAS